MVRLQVIDLLAEDERPDVLAQELDHVERVGEAGPVAGEAVPITPESQPYVPVGLSLLQLSFLSRELVDRRGLSVAHLWVGL